MYTVSKLPGSTDAKLNSVFINTSRAVNKYAKIIHNGASYGPFKIAASDAIAPTVIGLGSFHRELLKVVLNASVNLEFIRDNTVVHVTLKNLVFTIEPLGVSSNKPRTISIDESLLNEIKCALVDVPLISGCAYSFNNEYKLIPTFTSSENTDICDETIIYSMDSSTIVQFAAKPNYVLDVDLPTETNNIFKRNFNFVDIGIGGLDKQFEVIFRRAFASRLLPKKIIKDLGINHVRGIILHGPPGTGKTLIARQIGKILNCEEPKIVNGPSLLNKYVGESEENVRKLFQDAMDDASGRNLHLIICDEFDALARKRGGGDGLSSDINDKIVNQFLTMIDGPKALNNVLLICMTNRLDLIDEAMLRPGRLELQIEISLPDESGRLQILQIHTKKMADLGYLEGVDLNQIASMTNNFTGAELESVVKTAVSYSVSKELDPNDLSNVSKIRPLLTQTDFVKSCKEIKPQFGSHSEQIEIITSKPFELYSEDYAFSYNDMREKIQTLAKGNLMSCLITGMNYVGKTTLACQVAKACQYSCVKFVNSEALMHSNHKDVDLYDKFKSGYTSDSLIIVLDSVERLIEYSQVSKSCTYNNKILQTIFVLLDKIIEPNKKVVIILTSSKPDLMCELGLDELCTCKYELNDALQAKEFKKRKNQIM